MKRQSEKNRIQQENRDKKNVVGNSGGSSSGASANSVKQTRNPDSTKALAGPASSINTNTNTTPVLTTIAPTTGGKPILVIPTIQKKKDKNKKIKISKSKSNDNDKNKKITTEAGAGETEKPSSSIMVDDSQQHADSKQGKTCSSSSSEQPIATTISGSTSTKRKRIGSTMVTAAAAAEVKDPQSDNHVKTTILKDDNDGNKKTHTTSSNSSSCSSKNNPLNPLQEPGAWKCPSCENQNFASRHKCRSATCNTKRPMGVFVPPKFKSGDGNTDGEKKESTKWPAQAGEERIQHNEYLRKRYLETVGGDAGGDVGAKAGEGMSEEDIARAKLLIERDERKKLQRETKKKNKALKKKNKENNRNSKKRKPNEETILVEQEVV